MEKASFPILDLVTETTKPGPGNPGTWRCGRHDRDGLNEVPFGVRQLSGRGSCPDCTTEQQLCMGVPKRYIGATLTDFHEETPAQHRVGEVIRGFIEGEWRRGAGLLFTGNVGTAKTMLGSAVVNHWLQHHGRQSARFFTMLGLMRRIKDTWNPESFETQSMLLQRLRDYPLLVIDEVGNQFDSEVEHVLFTDLINERYNLLHPTILITNLTVEHCTKTLGDRVMDRLRDGGHALAFSWPSQRG